MREVTYYGNGRMKYNPEYHPNTGRPWTEEDLEYLCKYYDVDDLETLAMALGRTSNSVEAKKYELERQGKYEYYKNLNKYW